MQGTLREEFVSRKNCLTFLLKYVKAIFGELADHSNTLLFGYSAVIFTTGVFGTISSQRFLLLLLTDYRNCFNYFSFNFNYKLNYD